MVWGVGVGTGVVGVAGVCMMLTSGQNIGYHLSGLCNVV